MLRFLARCVALLFAVLFVPVTVATLFFSATGTHLPRAQTYKDSLDRAQFYTKAPKVFAETLSRGLEAGLGDSSINDEQEAEIRRVLHELKPADWESLLATAIPPALLRIQIEGGLDQFFNFVHDDQAAPSVKIGFTGLKDNLKGAELENTYLQLLSHKPAYTEGVRKELIPVLYCPPEAELPKVKQAFKIARVLISDKIPDSVDLLSEVVNADRSGNTLAALNHSRMKIREYEQIARWSPILPALLLLLVAAFGVRSLSGALLWWGIPCLVAGVCAAILALPSASAAHWLFTQLILPQLPPQIPALTLDTVVGLLTSAMEVVLNSVLVSASSIGLCGLIAILLACLLGRKSGNQES